MRDHKSESRCSGGPGLSLVGTGCWGWPGAPALDRHARGDAFARSPKPRKSESLPRNRMRAARSSSPVRGLQRMDGATWWEEVLSILVIPPPQLSKGASAENKSQTCWGWGASPKTATPGGQAGAGRAPRAAPGTLPRRDPHPSRGETRPPPAGPTRPRPPPRPRQHRPLPACGGSAGPAQPARPDPRRGRRQGERGGKHVFRVRRRGAA